MNYSFLNMAPGHTIKVRNGRLMLNVFPMPLLPVGQVSGFYRYCFNYENHLPVNNMKRLEISAKGYLWPGTEMEWAPYGLRWFRWYKKQNHLE